MSSAKSIYSLFETDKSVEREGVTLDYGVMRLRVARAGGANTRFASVLRERLAPHKRAIATETMSDDLAQKISLEVFAETVVLGWDRPIYDKDGKETGEYQEGIITGKDGKDIAFSADAVKALFKDLPDLARDVFAQAQSVALFRKTIADIDAGN